jgi:L-ascorbate metabolism protein UlaG (beta-lactamase superfamily)
MKGQRVSWLRRVLLGLVIVLAMLVALGVADGWSAFGHRAQGARRARMEASPHWGGGHFVNPEPLRNSFWGAVWGALHRSPEVRPHQPLPTVVGAQRGLEVPAATGLRVTWLGHSTVLVELDGCRILLDPVFSERASPFDWVGPSRWFPPPIALTDLPPIDAVLISHDHYDHLDWQTLLAMKDWSTTFIVPLGVGAHLAYWGVPEAHIVELDWWEHTAVGRGALSIVATPARHASGRTVLDDDATLWAGYALIGAQHRVYYSGDTGLFPALADIGSRLGPFDLTILEVGQYGSAWPDWHMGPEQAVRAHQMVLGRVLLPVHWGTFALAYHAWTEPIERTLAAAAAAGVTVVAPEPGQSLEPEAPPPLVRWWPTLPWRTGLEDPIVSTQMQ